MRFWECIAKAIGMIWRFLTTAFIIALVGFIAFFIFLIVMPENTMQAIEVVKGFFS